MTYETIRFGAIEVKEEEILRFSEGLYGFEHEHEYSIIPFDPNVESPLEWMQSLKTPELAFVITDPFLYKSDYRLVLTDEEEKQLQIKSKESLIIRIIVTIPEDYTRMTGNFIAPLVINGDPMIAKQVVLTSPDYDTREYLLPQDPGNAPETAS